jgi:putative flippase GtrA
MIQDLSNWINKYRPLCRWALVGVTTTTMDYVLFVFMYFVTSSVLTANLFAGLVSIGFNYSAHYFWSFQSQINHEKVSIRYLINLISFWSLNTLILKALISMGIDPKIAKLIPISIIAPLSFISLRFFVFKKSTLPNS